MGAQLDGLAAIVAREALWWDSVDLEIRMTHEVLPSWIPEVHFVGSVERYVETRDGLRRYEQSHRDTNGRDSTRVYCYDGSRNVMVSESPAPGADRPRRDVLVQTSFAMEEGIGGSVRPHPLAYMYVGKRYLHESLDEARPLGPRQVGPFRCQALEFADILWGKVRQTVVYSIDEAHGIPVKVDVYSLKAPDHPHTTWEVLEVSRVDGHPFPTRMRLVGYKGGADGAPPTVDESRRIDVTSVKFNTRPEAALFRPEFPPGALVLDAVAKKEYRVPEGPGPALKGVPPAPPAVVATAPTSWADHGPALAFGVGLALLTSGLLLHWRSRRASRPS